MIPFYALIGSFILFQSLGLLGIPIWNDWQEALRYAVGVMFLLAASAHRGKRRPDLVAMVPPAFPNPGFIVTATGVLEMIGAIGLVIPKLSAIAAIGLTCMLVAMFPANVHAASRKLTIGGRPVPPLLQRTLLQAVFIAAAVLTIDVF
ncbi:DoxX family protein [Paenibacillus sp. NEAU-GSW1]|uniref:DoxX family protein n=1 Tax=Paenibacillus sp. NEAU-GSW1 TaxID=2682486 RepID=UPI0012E257D9|nr:DoxX family protein [Paenibacillus sp. NEAU-GSW1]MUT68282.1 hypothetical protein [Paenibacillus sp. NEAU-GSW1]